MAQALTCMRPSELANGSATNNHHLEKLPPDNNRPIHTIVAHNYICTEYGRFASVSLARCAITLAMHNGDKATCVSVVFGDTSARMHFGLPLTAAGE